MLLNQEASTHVRQPCFTSSVDLGCEPLGEDFLMAENSSNRTKLRGARDGGRSKSIGECCNFLTCGLLI